MKIFTFNWEDDKDLDTSLVLYFDFTYYGFLNIHTLKQQNDEQ